MHYLSVVSYSSRGLWSAGKSLEIRVHTELPSPSASGAAGTRVSPIFPLEVGQKHPGLSEGKWHVQFVAPVSARRLLARVQDGAYPELVGATWFGVGVASLILFLREPKTSSRFLRDSASEILTVEKWTVVDGAVTRTTPAELPPMQVDYDLPSLPEGGYGADVSATVEELRQCLDAVFRQCGRMAPDELRKLQATCADLELMISQIAFLVHWGAPRDAGHTEDSAVPRGLEGYDVADPLTRERLLQQRLDRIVQVNSALSYVISQSSYGAPPVLGDTALLRRHSLLGVGRAHRALTNVVRRIEESFNRFPVRAALYNAWGSAPPLPGFSGATEHCESHWWAGQGISNLVHHADDDGDHKFVYISGRLGFRESEYAVSASIHALVAGETPRWHLTTMSHEVLHGHVRDVLNALFDRVRDSESEEVDAFWETLYSRFSAHMHDERPVDMKLIDSARHVVLSYCCQVQQMGSLTALPARPYKSGEGKVLGDLVVPDTNAELRRLLAAEVSSVAEVMVHVLDLFYFYDDDTERYAQAIWSSWASVPAVMRDVRQYVLRTLLACTAPDQVDEVGKPMLHAARFSRARRGVSTALSSLPEEFRTHPIVLEARRVLALASEREADVGKGPPLPRPITDEHGSVEQGALVEEAGHELFQAFLAAIRIVDFTRHCVATPAIRTDLLAEGGDYGFELGRFEDRAVPSVPHFVALHAGDRVSEARAKPTDHDEERHTAWFLIATGDFDRDRGPLR